MPKCTAVACLDAVGQQAFVKHQAADDVAVAAKLGSDLEAIDRKLEAYASERAAALATGDDPKGSGAQAPGTDEGGRCPSAS